MKWLDNLTARFLNRFAEVRMLRGIEARYLMESATARTKLAQAKAAHEALAFTLKETERGLAVMTDARMNLEKSHEFLKGELEALKQAHEREVDGLKRMIDFFSPTLAGRTVFGLAPNIPQISEERQQPMGSQNRRSLSREAYLQFYQEALEKGMHPNPNGDPPADFSVKQ